jgi:DNA primase
MSATAQSVLKSKFKRIYICFDNDPPGLADARSLSSTTGFQNIILPQFPQGKDISDLYKALGKEEFLKIINPLFDNNAEQKN